MDSLEQIARSAEEQGDLRKAYQLWSQLSLDSKDPVHFCHLGYVAKNLGMWNEAEDAFLSALQGEPRFPEALQGPGSVYLHRPHNDLDQDARMARDRFVRALELQRSAHGATLLRVAYALLGQDDAARAAYTQALQVDPQYEEAYYNIAKLEEEGNPLKAIELFEKAIRIDPEYSLGHQELGKLYQQRGDLARAEHHFRQSLDADPTDYWSYMFLANLLSVKGEKEEAEATYRLVTSLHPEIKGGLEFFARFLDSIGRQQEAATVRAQINESR